MMQRLPRAERLAVLLWLIVAVAVWNGVYDILLTRGVQESLFRAALHQAGRAPAVPLAQVMDLTVRDAIWIATLWSALILLAGLTTIRLLRPGGQAP
jgi:hypothetical protein